jgi:hypothetical protein
MIEDGKPMIRVTVTDGDGTIVAVVYVPDGLVQYECQFDVRVNTERLNITDTLFPVKSPL